MKLRVFRQKRSKKCGDCRRETLGEYVYTRATSRQPICVRCATRLFGMTAVAVATLHAHHEHTPNERAG